MVRNKRNVANPNSSFYTQLKVWEQCRYNIQASISIDGVKPYKLEYQVRAFLAGSWREQTSVVDAENYRNGWQISKRQTEKRRQNANRDGEKGRIVLGRYEEIGVIEF